MFVTVGISAKEFGHNIMHKEFEMVLFTKNILLEGLSSIIDKNHTGLRLLGIIVFISHGFQE